MVDLKFKAFIKMEEKEHYVEELVWDEDHNLRWVKIGDRLLDLSRVTLKVFVGDREPDGTEIYTDSNRLGIIKKDG